MNILSVRVNNKNIKKNTRRKTRELYKAKWDVEVFFKHLKQVKTFDGTSANPIRIQMWSHMILIKKIDKDVVLD